MLSELRPGQRRTVSEAEQGRTTLWRRFRGILHGGSAEPLAFCCPNWLFENLIWTGVVGDLPHSATAQKPSSFLSGWPSAHSYPPKRTPVNSCVAPLGHSDRKSVV